MMTADGDLALHLYGYNAYMTNTPIEARIWALYSDREQAIIRTGSEVAMMDYLAVYEGWEVVMAFGNVLIQ